MRCGKFPLARRKATAKSRRRLASPRLSARWVARAERIRSRFLYRAIASSRRTKNSAASPADWIGNVACSRAKAFIFSRNAAIDNSPAFQRRNFLPHNLPVRKERLVQPPLRGFAGFGRLPAVKTAGYFHPRHRRLVAYFQPAVSRMISRSGVCGRNFTKRSSFFTSGLRRRMSSKSGAPVAPKPLGEGG